MEWTYQEFSGRYMCRGERGIYSIFDPVENFDEYPSAGKWLHVDQIAEPRCEKWISVASREDAEAWISLLEAME
jgi:hypothetical protein